MKKTVITFLMLAFVGGTFYSCKDDSTSATTNTSTGKLTDSDKAKLYDKVWYPAGGGGGIEHEFLSDNTLRLSLSLEGRWVWENNGDTMNIKDPSGNRYYYLFLDIGENTMSFKQSVDNYQGVYNYQDTK